MVTANTILESFAYSCRQSDIVPNDVTFATVELDSEGEHSDVSLPVVEIFVTNIERSQERNTERVGVECDDAGNEIGYVYTQWFTLNARVMISTVPQTRHTHRDLDRAIRKSLYRHDSYGPRQALPDPNESGTLSDIDWVHVNEIRRDNDFSLSPSVRGRQFDVEIGFTHEITSSDLGIDYETVDDVRVTTDVVYDDDAGGILTSTADEFVVQ
jgi:hypothetical protein